MSKSFHLFDITTTTTSTTSNSTNTATGNINNNVMNPLLIDSPVVRDRFSRFSRLTGKYVINKKKRFL